MPKLCPNITFPHQQDFFPIRSVTKSSTARFSHENLVEKFKIFVQDFVPIRTALWGKNKQKTFRLEGRIVCIYVWSALSAEYGSTRYMVPNLARGQLNRKIYFSLSSFAPENMVARDGTSSFSTLGLIDTINS